MPTPHSPRIPAQLQCIPQQTKTTRCPSLQEQLKQHASSLCTCRNYLSTHFKICAKTLQQAILIVWRSTGADPQTIRLICEALIKSAGKHSFAELLTLRSFHPLESTLSDTAHCNTPKHRLGQTATGLVPGLESKLRLRTGARFTCVYMHSAQCAACFSKPILL